MDFPQEVDWDDLLSLAEVWHVEYMREHGKNEPDIVSIYDLQRTGEAVANTYYDGQYGSEVARYKLAVAYGAALLYSFDRYGLSFEIIQDRVSYDFAKLIASISSDNRLPRAQRIIDMQSRVARACTVGQLIKLAEMVNIYQRLGDIVGLLKALPPDRHIRREFADRAIDYLEIAARLCTTMVNLKENKSFATATMSHKPKYKQLAAKWEAARSFVDDPDQFSIFGKVKSVSDEGDGRTTTRRRRTASAHRSEDD